MEPGLGGKISSACCSRVRVLQALSVLSALAGLILLGLFFVEGEISSVQIGQLTPAMNFESVRVDGEVTRDAHLLDSGGLVFSLDDGTGKIRVYGSRPQAEDLLRERRFPRRGDRVSAIGTLGLSDGRIPLLQLASVDALFLTRKPVAPGSYGRMTVAEVMPGTKGKLVAVSGVLREITLPAPGSKAPYLLTIEECGAQLDIIFWDEVFCELNGTFPVPGTRLDIRGRVSLYKGQVQLKLMSADDLLETAR